MLKYLERFDPDGDCRIVALDFIATYLTDTVVDETDLVKISNLIKTCEFLHNKRFKFTIKIPLLSILSPVAWILISRYLNKISFGKLFNLTKTSLQKSKTRYATLYHLTAKQLYRIEGQLWTHCIVGYYDKNSKYCIYDPLFKKICKEYKINPRTLNEKNLDDTLSVKILIW